MSTTWDRPGRARRLLLVGVLVVLVAAGGAATVSMDATAQEQEPSPTPSATAAPQATPAPSVTAEPQPTPIPSASPAQEPGPTPSPSASAEPAPSPAGHQRDATRQVLPSRYIVTLRDAADLDAVARAGQELGGGQPEHVYRRAITGFSVTLPPHAAAQLERNPRVARVEPDQVVEVQATQSSPPWGLDRVDQRPLPLDAAYRYAGVGTGTDVYVVDTGIRASHTEFAGRVTSGFDALGEGRTDDCNGHGTHVAGTVGGQVSGVAKGVRLVPVRVLGCDGAGTMSGVIAGVDWVTGAAAGTPAVVNMSLGGGASRTLDDAVRRSLGSGLVYVVAAGNANVDACTQSPARVAEAITVGATDRSDRRASFSNFGSCVDVFAPGTSISSAWHTSNTELRQLSGTSMAAPHVAGVAALLRAGDRASPQATVVSALLAEATPGVVVDPGAGSPNRLLFTGDTTPPGPVSELTPSAGFRAATLTWRNPPDPDFDLVTVRRATGTTAPRSATGGTEAYRGSGSSTTVRSIPQATDQSFSVFALDRAGNASEGRRVTLRGTTMSRSVSARTITHGQSVTIRGTLAEASTGSRLAGRAVHLLRRAPGTTSWTRVSTLTSTSTGTVSATHRPGSNTEYALRFRGAAVHIGSQSTAVTVSVRQRVTATLSATSVRRGASVRLTGSVAPNHAGQQVRLQRNDAGTWRNVGTATLSSSSTYRFSLSTSTRGKFTYRVVRPADGDHARGISPTRTLSVS